MYCRKQWVERFGWLVGFDAGDLGIVLECCCMDCVVDGTESCLGDLDILRLIFIHA